MIGAAERLNQLGPRALGMAIEHMQLEPFLCADQRRQQADGTGAGDGDAPRPPGGAGADTRDLLPGLRDHGRRLEQHAEPIERAIELHQELRLAAKALGAEAVPRLDAALGVPTVEAHVPLAIGASGARGGIGAADDADDEVADAEAAAARRFLDPAQQFMADDEPVLAGRRCTVAAGHDLRVGAANAKRKAPHEDRAVRGRWFGHVRQGRRIRDARKHRQRQHRRSIFREGARQAPAPPVRPLVLVNACARRKSRDAARPVSEAHSINL